MWKEYFGPGANIIGIDINPACNTFKSMGVDIFIGSQDDEELLEDIVRKYGGIDIVIDDGSHLSRHLIKTFEYLYPHVSANGLYLLEDLHACYDSNHEGGYLQEGSFIEYCKARMDSINATYTGGQVAVDAFTRTTDSMSVYDSVVVFEKRPQGSRNAFITGPM